MTARRRSACPICGAGCRSTRAGPGIGNNYQIGENGGVESVTLTTQQIPIHNHACCASQDRRDAATPAGAILRRDQAGVRSIRPPSPTDRR